MAGHDSMIVTYSSGNSDRIVWKLVCGCIGWRDELGEAIVDTVSWTLSSVIPSERWECCRYMSSPKCHKKSPPKIGL